jgi:hypothetical protein
MKRLCIMIYSFLIMALLLPAASFANPPIALLVGATATGAGAVKIPAETYKDWGCVATITGAPTAVKVCLQGDPSGGSYYSDMVCIEFSETELTAGYAARGGSTQIANSIRGNVVTLTAGTSPTVSLWCTGVK